MAGSDAPGAAGPELVEARRRRGKGAWPTTRSASRMRSLQEADVELDHPEDDPGR